MVYEIEEPVVEPEVTPSSKDWLQALLRKFLTVLGTVLVYRGILHAEEIAPLMDLILYFFFGAGSLIASTILSVKNIKKLKNQVIVDIVENPAQSKKE